MTIPINADQTKAALDNSSTQFKEVEKKYRDITFAKTILTINKSNRNKRNCKTNFTFSEIFLISILPNHSNKTIFVLPSSYYSNILDLQDSGIIMVKFRNPTK